MNPASLNAKAPDTYKAKLTTGKGDIVIQVTRSWSPLGADRFYNLVKNGFFTNAAFFRIVPGFVVQFGLNAKPELNRVWQSANIQDDPVTQSNRRGTVTFATAGPGTRTTQIFINLGENARLDGMGFSPFGEITAGLDIVDKLNQEYGEQPQQDRIQTEGAAYLSKSFPNLDVIKSASIVVDTPAGVPAPAKPAVPGARPATAAPKAPTAAPKPPVK